MNGNRMKYSSAPTYGMQKRGFSKKPNTPPQANAPDFTQQPVPDLSMSPMAQQPAVATPPYGFPQQNNNFAPPSYFPMQNGTPAPPMQGMGYTQPAFNAPPSFMSPAYAPPSPYPTASQPIGNMTPMAPSSQPSPFSPRAQGFVPPAVPNTPTVIGANALPQISSMDPFTQPYPGQAFSPQAVLQRQAYPMADPASGFGGGYPQQGAPTMPMNHMQQLPFPANQQPMQKAPRQPISKDKLVLFYLFGFLPLLFIPCLFVSPALDLLRYAFLVLCAVGVGLMWYTKMFTTSTRATVSIIYAALCIVTVSMLISGGNDVQTTGAPASAQSQGVQNPADPNAGAPVGLTAEPQPQATPEPVLGPGESEAEQRLTMFMEYWTAGLTEQMVSLVQPSWATVQDNPAAALFTVLANRRPEEHSLESISGSEADNSRTVTMSALINKNNGKDPIRFRFMVLMVKENGEWYVDPNSLATNDEITSQDPNATPEPSFSTQAPRMTVTPIPDASTKLYYNPDGGHYYHRDASCESIAEKYRPLGDSFLYSELGAHSSLKPCLKCDAPTAPKE